MNINPKIDLIFKKLFGTEENKDILLSLINAILPPTQQVKTIVLKNPYNLADYLEGKLSILDIKAEDENQVQYDIEMQIKGTDFYGRRVLYYWAKMFGSQLDTIVKEGVGDKKKKQGYSDLRKCIVISLMDFSFFEDERYHRCFTLTDRETHQKHKDLDYLDLYFVELDKFYEETDHIKNTLDRWITFLNNAHNYSERNLPRELAVVKEIKKATEKLSVMQLNEQERMYYESQQRFLLDENTRQVSMEEKIKAAEAKVKAAEKKARDVEKRMKAAEEKSKAAEEKSKAAEEKSKAAEEKSKAAEEKSKAAEAAKEAAKNRILEIARNLKKTGAAISLISELTGLSLAEIEKLN